MHIIQKSNNICRTPLPELKLTKNLTCLLLCAYVDVAYTCDNNDALSHMLDTSIQDQFERLLNYILKTLN